MKTGYLWPGRGFDERSAMKTGYLWPGRGFDERSAMKRAILWTELWGLRPETEDSRGSEIGTTSFPRNSRITRQALWGKMFFPSMEQD